jgi:hypothetical protein
MMSGGGGAMRGDATVGALLGGGTSRGRVAKAVHGEGTQQPAGALREAMALSLSRGPSMLNSALNAREVNAATALANPQSIKEQLIWLDINNLDGNGSNNKDQRLWQRSRVAISQLWIQEKQAYQKKMSAKEKETLKWRMVEINKAAAGNKENTPSSLTPE